jgi:hypothetical protein
MSEPIENFGYNTEQADIFRFLVADGINNAPQPITPPDTITPIASLTTPDAIAPVASLTTPDSIAPIASLTPSDPLPTSTKKAK